MVTSLSLLHFQPSRQKYRRITLPKASAKSFHGMKMIELDTTFKTYILLLSTSTLSLAPLSSALFILTSYYPVT